MMTLAEVGTQMGYVWCVCGLGVISAHKDVVLLFFSTNHGIKLEMGSPKTWLLL